MHRGAEYCGITTIFKDDHPSIITGPRADDFVRSAAAAAYTTCCDGVSMRCCCGCRSCCGCQCHCDGHNHSHHVFHDFLHSSFPFLSLPQRGVFFVCNNNMSTQTKNKKETAFAVSERLFGCSCCTELCFGASRKADCRSAAINNGISGASI